MKCISALQRCHAAAEKPSCAAAEALGVIVWLGLQRLQGITITRPMHDKRDSHLCRQLLLQGCRGLRGLISLALQALEIVLQLPQVRLGCLRILLQVAPLLVAQLVLQLGCLRSDLSTL